MFRQTLQKLRDGGCEIDDPGAPAGGEDVAAEPKAKPGRKRKAAGTEGIEDGAKKQARGKKATEAKAVKVEDAADEDVGGDGGWS